MQDFDQPKLRRELLLDARAIGIPSGAAEDFVDRSITAAMSTLSSKSLITDQDLKRAITKELKKYHPDLAYVYQNRDKII
ncbi:hypothetical protein IJI28_00365 [Candidatus Saccharibacteria bacterium]|nr:hypothetical protein [Candidatus Saccharibacteria bacterium]